MALDVAVTSTTIETRVYRLTAEQVEEACKVWLKTKHRETHTEFDAEALDEAEVEFDIGSGCYLRGATVRSTTTTRTPA